MEKVIVLTSTFPRWKDDSTPSFVFDLARHMAKYYRIFVLAPHAHKAKLHEKINDVSVHRFRYFAEKYQKVAYGAGILPNVKGSFLATAQVPIFLASEYRNACNIIEKEKIDLIHAHWMIPQGLIGAYLKKKYKLPLLVTIHGSDLFPLKSRILMAIQLFVLKNADLITINSMAGENELISRFPGLKGRVARVPMGIDRKIFSPDNVAKRQYKSQKIILFVGRLNEQKGVEYLLEALVIVKSKIKGAKLLIIGEGEHKKKLQETARKLEVSENVEFLGAMKGRRIADFYRLSDVFILPSVTSKMGTEAFGLVLVEAMSCGACVIGSSSGGIKEIIKDGYNGLIFQEKNPRELAEKIIGVLGDGKLRNTLVKNGLEFSKGFDWKIIGKKFENIYSGLLK